MADKTSPILTDEEAVCALNEAGLTVGQFGRRYYDIDITGNREIQVILKAQAKKIHDEMDKLCPHYVPDFEGDFKRRRECPMCWQLLLEKEG